MLLTVGTIVTVVVMLSQKLPVKLLGGSSSAPASVAAPKPALSRLQFLMLFKLVVDYNYLILMTQFIQVIKFLNKNILYLLFNFYN